VLDPASLQACNTPHIDDGKSSTDEFDEFDDDHEHEIASENEVDEQAHRPKGCHYRVSWIDQVGFEVRLDSLRDLDR
jgi:hypothetical protein